MKRIARIQCALLAGAISLVYSTAAAQQGPRGPADVIGGARRARDAQDLERATERAGTPPAHEEAEAPEAAGDPHAGAAAMHPGLDDEPDQRPIAAASEDASLPKGTIVVRVVDPSGAPAIGADVSLGIMSAESARSSRDAKTGADGRALFSGLATGEKQAYRVNVPYQGAKYSSTPFRLPEHGGYAVQIRRLPVTHDERMVVLYLGATSVELKDERLKVVQQAKLLNLGATTYVFPPEGTLVRFPKGFLAVQTQEVMTDQHVAEAAGEGVRVKGSLPPGEVTLLWGFDLPSSGSEADFTIDMPWLIFAYRVITDAPPGLTLQVEGMPDPIVHADAGRRFFVTEVQRKVGDEPFRRLHIMLHGLPAPGPARWIAAALALLAILAGVFGTLRKDTRAQPDASTAFEAHKRDLIERARELQAARQAGDIGPEYHAQQMGDLETAMAELLFEQEQHKGIGTRKQGVGKSGRSEI